MPATWRVVSEIYEEGKDFPIVVHIFFGQSDREAAGYYRAHLETDTFLADCTQHGSFQGRFTCQERHRLERIVQGQWVPYVRSGGWASMR